MALGYRLYWHLPALYNPDPVAVQCTVSINMLCAPPLRLVDVSDLTLINSADDDWRLAYERRKQAPAPVPIKKKQWAVVARLGGVGDNLMASAVLPYLKEKYGFVEVISATPQHVVFENNPYVDKLSIKQPGQPKWEDGKKWQEYWLDRASEVAFFAQLSHSCEGLRAYNESQTAFYWSDTARRKFAGHSYLETVADICEVPYDQLKPDFFPTETEVAQARNVKELVGGRYVAWVISGTRPDKIWPPAAAAIYRIIRELDTAVVLFGMPGKDFEIAKEIEKSVNIAAGSTRGLHLALSTSTDAPNWPLRRVLTQVQLADVVVSPDTGPAWAVAMHAIPKIIMVSHASPENITKHWRNTLTLHADPGRVACWPCHCLHDTKESCERLSGRKDEVGAACISDITVDKVIDAVAACLRTGGFNTAALAAE